MKSLKYLLFLLLILVIGFSIYVAMQPNSFQVTRTRTIKAPSAVIYNNVIDFKNWESWVAWVENEPSTVITLSEKTEGVGGSYSWEDKDGFGTIKTISTTLNTSIEQKLQFDDFHPSKVNWTFAQNEDNSTDVTWDISGENLPFIFKAFNVVMGGMEKQIGPDFERGLEKLDSIVVSSMKAYHIEINGVSEYGGGFYLYKTTNATSSNISQVMEKQYVGISMFMRQNNIAFAGMPFTIYHDMNMGNGTVIMSNAIPINEKIVITGNSDILCDYMPKLKVLKTVLKGNYTNLPEAWKTTMKFIDENNINQSDMNPFEIYTNDPVNVPNPADWITEIYVPIKE